ncbi:olfactory receptor 10D3 [Procambarus clarkii]|uniref:olfactory receptor 10D3 n=1 Tax=Procambarus clarkii TaxID=6728 RepID=UPI003744191A
MDSKHRKHIIYIILSIIAMIECVITLLINVTDRTLKAKPSTAFANSLTASIWLLSAISLVSNVIFETASNMIESVWPCIALAICVRYLHIVTCFNFTSLAFDRYLAICQPLHYSRLLTRARCHLLCLACWVAPCLFLILPCGSELPTLCSKGRSISLTFLVAYTVIYTLVTLATIVLYSLVALEFRRESLGHAQDKERTERLLRKRTAASALKVLMLYICLGLPHTVYPLLMKLIKQEDKKVEDLLNEIFYYINRIQLLFFLPVYAWANTSFHHALNARARRLVMWVAALLADLCCDRRRNRIQSEESTQTESM